MAPIFPAVLIGGPPHSGKSTLLYRLSHALRDAGIEHYALRANPDGEGDWSNEAPDPLVRELRGRARSGWSTAFAEQISADIARRHLPLLVDAGGKASAESALIAAACTHGVLLAANLADLSPWQALLARQGRPIVAILRSTLEGPQRVDDDGPVLRGTISGLGRGHSSAGVCFNALIERLRPYLAYSAAELYRAHQALSRCELVLHLERPIYPLPAHSAANPWRPDELPALLEGLPAEEPLAIYGRGPLWLYGALAAFTRPAPEVFNPRNGWVTPPPLTPGGAPDPARLTWDAVTPQGPATLVQLSIPGGYLDVEQAANLPIPALPANQGVILDGRLPNWLFAALARAYRGAAWVAIYQPQLGAVVVCSQDRDAPVGQVIERGG